ncbi:MAG: ABC transporter ATP-binding protein, partial [Candidatus Binataceae bacterium]
VMLLLPLLEVVGVNLDKQGEVGHYARIIAGGFTAVGIHPTLLVLLALFVVIMAARAMLGRLSGVAIGTVEQNLVDVLRRRLYRAIIGANWLFITRSRSSDFAHALTDELTWVGFLALQAVELAGDLVMGLLYVGLALMLSASMTLLVLAAGAALAFGLRGKVRSLQQHGEELTDQTTRLYAASIEHLQTLKTAKTYGAQARNFDLFSALSRLIAATNIEVAREQAAAGWWFELGATIILGAVLYVSIEILAVPSAAILILLLLFARLMPRLMSAHRYYRAVVNGIPYFTHIRELENRCLAAAEPEHDGAERPRLRREIRLEGVGFAYQPGSVAAANDLDMIIPAGGITAIVGPSGAGKSTIADLVMGLMAPDSGRITIDGVPLDPPGARAWRQQIGYVAQEALLFNLSVRENLLWARPQADETEMREALRMAAAEDFTLALPNGIDTMVGERGALISQGERQRLALARALLRRPALLILDEATNSLDYENEARVLGTIEALRGGLTVLMIAHRLSAIRWADLIYVIEDGRVVESGEWGDLNQRRDGRLRALYEAHSLVA